MTRVMGVDPGKHGEAAVILWDGVLGVVATEGAGPWLTIVEAVTVEMPDHLHRGTVEDLIAVVRTAQDLLTRANAFRAKATEVSPTTWKGSLEKWIYHQRLLEAVSDDELREFAAAFNKKPEQIQAYVDRACEQHARGKRPAYQAEFTHYLDAWGIARFAAGVVDKHGFPVRK